MGTNIKPIVLLTVNNERAGESMRGLFGQLGIDIQHFMKNDDVFAPGMEYVRKAHYDAAIISAYTGTDTLPGEQLINKLVTDGICDDTLTMTTHSNRKVTQSAIDRANIQKPVQLFDELYEQYLLILYVEAKVLYPEESRDLTREKLIRSLGFNVLPDGGLPFNDIISFRRLTRDRLDECIQNTSLLRDLAIQASALEGGRMGHGLESEPR